MTEFSPSSHSSSSASPPREILVIEDDPGFVKILSVLNRAWGLPLVIRSRPEEIEQALASPDSYRVVISDCNVPRMDIFAALGALRSSHPAIDIVLMSNLDAHDLKAQGAAVSPAAIEPKEGIIREPDAFAARMRALLARHAG